MSQPKKSFLVHDLSFCDGPMHVVSFSLIDTFEFWAMIETKKYKTYKHKSSAIRALRKAMNIPKSVKL